MFTPRRRKPTRLSGFDYAQSGSYFVTLCTHERAHLFGQVIDGDMRLNAWGQIAYDQWELTAKLRRNVQIDAFVVMPNHTHAIIVIDDADLADHTPNDETPTVRRGLMHQTPTPPAHISTFGKPIAGSLGTIVATYKAAVTRAINLLREDRSPLWQRNFHDHIIRNEADLNRIRAYVVNNPSLWEEDVFYAEQW